MSIAERVQSLIRANSSRESDEFRLEAEETAIVFMEGLRKLGSPNSASPFRFEANRLLRNLENSLISIVCREDRLGSGPVFELKEFECEIGSHLQAAVVIDMRKVQKKDDEELIFPFERVLAAHEKLRQGKTDSHSLRRDHGALCEGQFQKFIRRRGVIVVEDHLSVDKFRLIL